MFWKSKRIEGQIEVLAGKNAIGEVKNWYSERYDRIIVQRNVLFLLQIISSIAIILSVIAITRISAQKSFDPFVIKVEEDSGIVTVVNPMNSEILMGNDTLAQYFIKKYLIARETYNAVDYNSLSIRIIRLLSSQNIFWQYLGYIKDDKNNLAAIYSDKNNTYLKIRSWSKLDNAGKKYVVRFSVNETSGARRVLNKIAVLEFNYVPMSLSEEDKDINPVGFQIIGYRVDEDNS